MSDLSYTWQENAADAGAAVVGAAARPRRQAAHQTRCRGCADHHYPKLGRRVRRHTRLGQHCVPDLSVLPQMPRQEYITCSPHVSAQGSQVVGRRASEGTSSPSTPLLLLAYLSRCLSQCGVRSKVLVLATGAAAKAQVQDFTAGAAFPVLIASYETIRLVADQLAGSCDLLICDEGHRCCHVDADASKGQHDDLPQCRKAAASFPSDDVFQVPYS